MSQQPVYGYPCVTDPRDFIPDDECCSSEEIAAHKLACETFGTPAYQPNKGYYEERDSEGRLLKHVTRTSWGIGTNLLTICDGCNTPPFGASLMTCHECGGHEFCEACWPEHEREHEKGRKG